jgi:ribosomal protein L37AE/L43A
MEIDWINRSAVPSIWNCPGCGHKMADGMARVQLIFQNRSDKSKYKLEI